MSSFFDFNDDKRLHYFIKRNTFPRTHSEILLYPGGYFSKYDSKFLTRLRAENHVSSLRFAMALLKNILKATLTFENRDSTFSGFK